MARKTVRRQPPHKDPHYRPLNPGPIYLRVAAHLLQHPDTTEHTVLDVALAVRARIPAVRLALDSFATERWITIGPDQGAHTYQLTARGRDHLTMLIRHTPT